MRRRPGTAGREGLPVTVYQACRYGRPFLNAGCALTRWVRPTLSSAPTPGAATPPSPIVGSEEHSDKTRERSVTLSLFIPSSNEGISGRGTPSDRLRWRGVLRRRGRRRPPRLPTYPCGHRGPPIYLPSFMCWSPFSVVLLAVRTSAITLRIGFGSRRGNPRPLGQALSFPLRSPRRDHLCALHRAPRIETAA